MALNDPLLNPFTPLAFLPPDIAQQYETSIYIVVATMSAFIWDWLMSLPEEIKIVRKRGFRPPMIAYFFSRIGTLGSCVLGTVYVVAPVANCEIMMYALGGCFVLALPSTSALFFFRVRAVYCNNKVITTFFGLLLIALFGLSFLIPLAPVVEHIGTTQRCITIRVARYAFAPAALNFLLDTLVFIAISFRFAPRSTEGYAFRTYVKTFFRGDGLPTISKSLLQDGQIYYCATISLHVIVIVLGLTSEYRAYRVVFSIPNIALENAMACRVYRGVKLGRITEDDRNIIKVSMRPFHQKGSELSVATSTTHPQQHVRGFKISHHDFGASEINHATEWETDKDRRSPDDLV